MKITIIGECIWVGGFSCLLPQLEYLYCLTITEKENDLPFLKYLYFDIENNAVNKNASVISRFQLINILKLKTGITRSKGRVGANRSCAINAGSRKSGIKNCSRIGSNKTTQHDK